MGVSAGPDIIENGLILALDAADKNSYPGSGTTWRDLSGNNNSGSLVNSPTFDTGSLGSIVFDGVDDYVNLGNTLNMGTDSITISIWTYVESTTSTSQLFSKSFAGEAFGVGRYWINIQSVSPRTGKIRAGFDVDDSGITVNTDGSTDLTDRGWVNITVVWDRSSTCRIYIDGILDGTGNISPGEGENVQSTLYAYLGAYNSDNNFSPSFFSPQKTSSFLYYRRVLSQAEILQNFNATKARFGL